MIEDPVESMLGRYVLRLRPPLELRQCGDGAEGAVDREDGSNLLAISEAKHDGVRDVRVW